MMETKTVNNTNQKKPNPGKRNRLDRRSGEDRRMTYSLDYFLKGGIERRKSQERRRLEERRTDWLRIDDWYSVYIGSDK